jgi:hypothetical protein
MKDRPERPKYTKEEVAALREKAQQLMGKLGTTMEKLGVAATDSKARIDELLKASGEKNAWIAQLMAPQDGPPDPAMAAQQGKLLGLLERLLSLQLRTKPQVAAAYLSREDPKALDYRIVLHEDTDENRAAVSALLEGYAQTQMAALAPAHMTFVTAEEVAGMSGLEAVDLA